MKISSPKIKTALLLVIVLGAAAFVAGSARAQEKEPPVPPLIQNLVNEGAQVRFLGHHNGLNGWVTIRNGQEQYFYAPQDGRSLLMGILFDADGKMVTARQVKELQEKSGDALDLFAETVPDPAAEKAGGITPEFKTPSEQLFDDVTNSNWIALGDKSAPVIYSFIDMQCPHCHAFLTDLRAGPLESGQVQVRVIPVGLSAQTKTQGAVLLAAPDPQERLYRHLTGDDTALPIPEGGINEQGVERNMSVMQAWKLDVTPLTVYRGKNGQVKIVQGRPKKLQDLINDIQ